MTDFPLSNTYTDPEPDPQTLSPTAGEFVGAHTFGSSDIGQAAERAFAPQVFQPTRIHGGALSGPLLSEDQRVLDPVEANETFAPKGQTLFDKPVTVGLARIMARQYSDNLQRDSTLSRWEDTHSWPVNLGSDLAASLVNPLNDAAALVPGFGEEAVAARLGGGLAARVAGRAVTGATGGAIGGAGLTALDDAATGEVSVKSALDNILLSAAGGAVLQGGLGSAFHEIIAPDKLMGIDFEKNKNAAGAALGQTISGRPLDVEPVLAPDSATVAPLGDKWQVLASDQYGTYAKQFDTEEEAQTVAGRLQKPSPSELVIALREREGASYSVTPEEIKQTKEDITDAIEHQTDSLIAPESRPEGSEPSAAGSTGAEPTAAPIALPKLDTEPAIIANQSHAHGGIETDEINEPSMASVRERLNEPDVQEKLKQPVQIVREPILYGAGSSTDGARIYIDPQLPKEVAFHTQDGIAPKVPSIDPSVPISIHERVEKIFLNKGLPYSEAHPIALAVEHAWVRDNVGEPFVDQYEQALKGWLKHDETSPLASTPKDLELKPYETNPKDLAAVQAAQAAQPLVTPETEPHANEPDVIAAQQALESAQKRADAYSQAADCLVEAGI